MENVTSKQAVTGHLPNAAYTRGVIREIREAMKANDVDDSVLDDDQIVAFIIKSVWTEIPLRNIIAAGLWLQMTAANAEIRIRKALGSFSE